LTVDRADMEPPATALDLRDVCGRAHPATGLESRQRYPLHPRRWSANSVRLRQLDGAMRDRHEVACAGRCLGRGAWRALRGAPRSCWSRRWVSRIGPPERAFRTNLRRCVAGNHYPEWARRSGRPGSSGAAGAGTFPRLWVTCAALARVPTLGATPVAGAALALGRDIRQRFQGHHWRGFPYPGGWSIAPVAARPPPRIIAAASSPHTHAGSPARGPRASGTIRRCSPSTRRAP